MILCFCSSTKFYDIVKDYAQKLKNEGIDYKTPNLAFGCKEDAEIDFNLKKQLTLDHNERMDESDIIYIVNPKGYIGESVSMEMAYAKGAGKKVYALEQAQTPTKSAFIDEVKSIEEVIKEVKEQLRV